MNPQNFQPTMFQDMRHQELTTSVAIITEWMDLSLAWEPGDFGNITTLHQPYDKFWIPDIRLHNSIRYDTQHIGIRRLIAKSILDIF